MHCHSWLYSSLNFCDHFLGSVLAFTVVSAIATKVIFQQIFKRDHCYMYNRDVHTATCIHNNNNRYVLGSASNLYTVYTHVIASVYGCVHDICAIGGSSSLPLRCHAMLVHADQCACAPILYISELCEDCTVANEIDYEIDCVNQHP